MATPLEGLEFEITSNSDQASRHLDSLTDSLRRLRAATANLGSLTTAARNLQNLATASSNIDTNKLNNLANALSRLRSVRLSSTIASRISDLGTALRGITDADVRRLERISNALANMANLGPIRVPNLNGVRNTPQQNLPQNQVIPQSTSQVSGSTQNIRNLNAQLQQTATSTGPSFIQTIREMVGELTPFGHRVSLIARGLKPLLRYTALLPITLGTNFAGRIRESVSALGHMFSAIKRIALYRLIRSVIKEITQGLKEGINNIYAYSRALNGEFAAAMDNLATSSLYLKNSLGAMAAPIIQSLIPAINYAIDRIVTLMNVINMFVSALGGKATYTAAKKMETSFANAASGAAGAAKNAVDKIKSYTIGIDELNILEPDKGSGGGGSGGSGGAGGLNTADMFEEVDIDKSVSDFAKRLKEAFQKGDWAEVGKIIGNKFNDIVNKIEWGTLGSKVGDKLGAAITIGYNTLKTADTYTLGANVAEFFNKGLEKVNTDELGGLLVATFTKGADFLIGNLLNVDTALLAEKIGDFFKGAFNEATSWINNYRWEDVGDKFAKQIQKFVENLDWVGIMLSAGKFVGATQKALWAFIKGLLFSGSEEPTGTGLSIFDKDTASKSVAEELQRSTRGLFGPSGNVATPKAIGALTFTANVKDDSTTWWQNVTSWFNKKAKKGTSFDSKLNNDSSTWWSNLKQYWDSVNQKPVSSFRTNVKDESSTWLTNRNIWWDAKNKTPVSPFRTNVKDESGTWWKNANAWWNNRNVVNVSPFKTDVKNESGSWFNHTNQWWTEKTDATKATPFRTDVKNEGKDWWNHTVTIWNQNSKTLPLNATISNANKLWDSVKQSWDKTAGTLTLKTKIKIPVLESTTVKMPSGLEVPYWKINRWDTVWGAKGGIFDGATIFGTIGNKLLGAGEVGKEALLPLEQNTGWMDTIAERVGNYIGGRGDESAINKILDRLDVIERQLSSIGADTKRQADKPQNTVVSISGRTVRDAVVRQAQADGYSFT